MISELDIFYRKYFEQMMKNQRDLIEIKNKVGHQELEEQKQQISYIESLAGVFDSDLIDCIQQFIEYTLFKLNKDNILSYNNQGNKYYNYSKYYHMGFDHFKSTFNFNIQDIVLLFIQQNQSIKSVLSKPILDIILHHAKLDNIKCVNAKPATIIKQFESDRKYEKNMNIIIHIVDYLQFELIIDPLFKYTILKYYH